MENYYKPSSYQIEEPLARHSEEYINIQRHLKEAIEAGRKGQVPSREGSRAPVISNQLPELESHRRQRHYSNAAGIYLPTPSSQVAAFQYHGVPAGGAEFSSRPVWWG